jgi:hypothetical protein
VYTGRNLEELSMTPLTDWNLDELSYHHFIMAQMSPYLNQQGASLHRQVIKEIENRGNQTWNSQTPNIYDHF